MGQRKKKGTAGIHSPQWLFQIAFILYMTATYLQTTMYTQYAVLEKILPYMRYLSFVLLVLLIALTIRSDLRQSRYLKEVYGVLYCLKYCILCLLVGTLAVIVSIRTGDRTTLFVTAFLFAAKRSYLQHTLRIAFVMQSALLLFVIISSKMGIIPDLLIKRDAIPIRHSLGFTYPSVCTGYFFFLLVLYLWLYGESVRTRDLLWMEIINCLLYLLTDTRIIFLLGTALLAAAYCFCCRGADLTCTKWLYRKRKTGGISYRIYTILYDYVVVILFFFYALMCMLDQVSGGNSILDRILSGRLGLTVTAVRNYGIHLIADKIVWVGFGGTENTDALLEAYNFVDCSYAYILISYGILIFLAVMIYLVCMQKYIRKRESVWKSLLMVFIWSYCLLEPRLLEIQVNCFLLLGAPVLRMGKKRKGMECNG